MLICMTTRFLADFYLRSAIVGQKIALRLLWPPLDCWLIRLLFVVLFTDHLPEVITEFEYDPSRYLDILQEPPM